MSPTMTSPPPHWSDREFAGRDFRDEDLAGLRTERVVFTDCDFSGADLAVDFTLAALGGADLRGVDLSGCRLRETSLVRADLREAILSGADLTGARTEGLRLEGADLRGARVDSTLWITARCRGARIDIAQGLAFAAAHGLEVRGE